MECLKFECCIERTRCFVHISQNIETELNFPPSSELGFPSELLSTGCSEQRPESPLPFSLPRSLPVCRPIHSSLGSRSSNPCNHRSHHRSHPHPLDSLQEGGRQKDVTHHKRSSYMIPQVENLILELLALRRPPPRQSFALATSEVLSLSPPSRK